MDLKDQVAARLSERRGQYVSGARLSEELGVSRQAVNKAVAKLQTEGYVISSVTNRGYMLDRKCDLLSAAVISAGTGVKVFCFDCVTSTNAEAKMRFLQCGRCIVVSNAQTDGRKKDGGKFFSPPDNGVYFSIALPVEIPLDKTEFLRAECGEAVTEVINRTCGADAYPVRLDEIYSDDKKVAGILIECTFNAALKIIDGAVIGIGIYTGQACFEDAALASVFPDETRNTIVTDVYLNIVTRLKNAGFTV